MVVLLTFRCCRPGVVRVVRHQAAGTLNVGFDFDHVSLSSILLLPAPHNTRTQRMHARRARVSDVNGHIHRMLIDACNPIAMGSDVLCSRFPKKIKKSSGLAHPQRRRLELLHRAVELELRVNS